MDITPTVKPTRRQLEGAKTYFEDANDRQAERAAVARTEKRSIKAELRAIGAIALVSLVAAAVAPKDIPIEGQAVSSVAGEISHIYDYYSGGDIPEHVDMRAVDQAPSAQHQIHEPINQP